MKILKSYNGDSFAAKKDIPVIKSKIAKQQAIKGARVVKNKTGKASFIMF